MPIQNDLTHLGKVVSDDHPLPVTQALSKYVSRFSIVDTGSTTANADRQILAAPGAGLQYAIVSFQFSASTASAVSLKSGTTVIWHGHVPTSGNVTVTLPFPIFCGENAVLNVNTAQVGTIVRVCVQGYIV